MKSGIISASVKLFIAHFCYQAWADPVGWVLTEGGLSSANAWTVQLFYVPFLTGKLNIATAEVNTDVNTASLLFDVTWFSEIP